VVAALGPAALVEALGTIAVFNGLVRSADATGIPLDRGTIGATGGLREALDLNAYPSAANTDLTRGRAPENPRDVDAVFR
jgi:hypothetical protein